MKSDNEHWQYLDQHVEKMGYFFIVDALEDKFKIDKKTAIRIYEEWKAARPNPEAEAQLKAIGQRLGKEIEKGIGGLLN